MDIISKLNQVKHKELKAEEFALEEAKNILEEVNNQHRETFNKFGLLNFENQLKVDQRESEVDFLKKGNIYTLAQIKEIGFRYRLKFLPIKYFVGIPSPQIIRDLQEYEKKIRI